MQTTNHPEYVSEVPENDSEKLAVIKNIQAKVAAIDPTTLRAFWIITMTTDPDDLDGYYIIRDIAGTGPDKERMFEYGQEYMKALLERHFGPLTKEKDSPLQ